MDIMNEICHNNILIVWILVLVLFSHSISAQSTWKAPSNANEIQNPFKDDTNAIKNGKKLYTQFCVVCHGPKGKGDGVAGVALNPKPANFNTNLFKIQSDGAIFWKLSEGRPPMAPYKDVFTKEQRWQLVNYIRSLNKTN